MKKLRLKIGLMLSVVVSLPLLMAVPAGAIASPLDNVCKTRGAGTTAVCQDNKQTNKNSLNNILKKVINVLLIIVGLIAVLFIVIGGLRYVLSGGDANATKGAKNTIIYAIVGLILALVSYGIVNFVLNRL